MGNLPMSEIIKREESAVTLSPYQNPETFKDFWQMASSLAQTSMVPSDYRENPNNVLIALDMAARMNAAPLAVMQNLYVIEGRPSWSSTFIIAAIEGCGRFGPLRYRFTDRGDKSTEVTVWVGPKGNRTQEKRTIKYRDVACVAYTTELRTGEKLEGPEVSVEMAVLEGWYTKSGSKWVTMTDLMLRYRAAAFFGRLYAPGLLMGLKTQEEAHDIEDAEFTEVKPAKSPGEAVKNLGKQTQAPQSADVTDALEKAQTVPNIHVVTTGERTGKLGASRKTQKQAAQPLEVQEATVDPRADHVIPPADQGEDNGDWNF